MLNPMTSLLQDKSAQLYFTLIYVVDVS